MIWGEWTEYAQVQNEFAKKSGFRATTYSWSRLEMLERLILRMILLC